MSDPTRSDAAPERASRATAPWFVACGALLVAYGLGVQSGPAGASQGNPQQPPAPQPSTSGAVFATGDSNNRMIAVTGVDVTGQSVLYLVDTLEKRLAVYQASGGASGTRGVRLVGARRIDLDLALDGYNDQSEYSYKDLKREFDRLQQR